MIKKYTTKNGETRYLFQTYLGIDPLTGKERRTTRRGFKTMKEAKQAGLKVKPAEYEERASVESIGRVPRSYIRRTSSTVARKL